MARTKKADWRRQCAQQGGRLQGRPQGPAEDHQAPLQARHRGASTDLDQLALWMNRHGADHDAGCSGINNINLMEHLEWS